MLPAAHRLRKRHDFQRASRSGVTIDSDYFRIKYIKNILPTTRVGIVIPNKLIKKAVVRNRKKRQVRAAIGELLSSLPPGYDMVLFAQPNITGAQYADIRQALEESISHIK